MFCQILGQALVEGRVFHIDHHAADMFVGDLPGDTMRFFLRWQPTHRYVSSPVCEQYHQGKYFWV